MKLGTDITLDSVLTILDEHYNNVKALDALNQEWFQLQMADKETLLDWDVPLLRNLQVLAASFPECFPLYLKASPQKKAYSDYLKAAREAEKEDSMELS